MAERFTVPIKFRMEHPKIYSDAETQSIMELTPKETQMDLRMNDAYTQVRSILTHSMGTQSKVPVRDGVVQVDVKTPIFPKKLPCLVCQDEFPVGQLIYCDAPKNNDIHGFCQDCVIGYAKSAITEMPFTEQLNGLRCMQTNCPNGILFSTIRGWISVATRDRLESLIYEHNVNVAKLDDLEDCKICGFYMVISEPAKIDPVFFCPNLKCSAIFCRLCKRDFFDDHVDRTCEELDAFEKREKKYIQKERGSNP